MTLLRSTLVEAAAVVATGLVIGLAGNALHPDGLSLRYDYFAVESAPQPADGAAAPMTVEERLAGRGIGVMDLAAARALFEDELYAEGAYAFIDARNDKAYQEGHIPGAWQFDPYYMERYVGAVLPEAQIAVEVVVYCTGGKCSDSEIAAQRLIELGVPADRVKVFVGGVEDWRAAGLPLEQGARGSGRLVEAGAGEEQDER